MESIEDVEYVTDVDIDRLERWISHYKGLFTEFPYSWTVQERLKVLNIIKELEDIRAAKVNQLYYQLIIKQG